MVESFDFPGLFIELIVYRLWDCLSYGSFNFFQFDAILNRLTGREMLEMFARLRGIPASRIPDIVNAVIYQLNLAPHADKMCGDYR